MYWFPLKDRFQTELLKRGHCVGCSHNLVDAERADIAGSDTSIVTCSCRRIYIYNKKLNDYRRASSEDL